MIDFRSCNGPGLNPATALSAPLFNTSDLPEDLGLPAGEIVPTYQGRYAVNLICRIFDIGLGDEVLAPAYNCGAEVDPFLWVGAKVRLYRIDERANIDADDIRRRITPATKVVYVSHFFGWPQDIGNLARNCRDRGIVVVEDCALCLFSRGPQDTIGRIGDAAVYSFVKSLAMPEGGALFLKNGTLPNELVPFEKPPVGEVLFNTLPLIKKWLMNSSRWWQRHELTRRWIARSWKGDPANRSEEIEREMPRGNYFDGRKIGWTMSRLSRGLLSQTRPEEIVEKRRRNYLHLWDKLKDLKGIQPLYNQLPDGVCPLAFPFYVNDRAFWAEALEARGVLVGGWPSYHRGLDWSEFPEARRLKNNLMTIPVHQGLDLEHMNHIARSVRTIAEEHDHHHGR